MLKEKYMGKMLHCLQSLHKITRKRTYVNNYNV